MRYILSFILVIVLNLPNCGMVFARMADTDMAHSMWDHMSLEEPHTDTDIQETGYSCCPNSDTASMRNTIATSSEVKTVSALSHIRPEPFELEHLPRPSSVDYRIHSPPDPSEYCSLIGCMRRLD